MKKTIRLTESDLTKIIRKIIEEQKPVTGSGNQHKVTDNNLVGWITQNFAPDALSGTFSSNGTKVTLTYGGKTKVYPRPINVGGSRMTNQGTWSRDKNMSVVTFVVTP